MTTHGSPSAQPNLLGASEVARATRTRRSTLWAAYADALGFIGELTDDKGLQRRTRGERLDHLMAWTRRVGGRGGVDVELPAGTWSDDTQLRLSVSRAISKHGFDVESFARIEVPVWPAYALGGGRASKTAAANLAKPDTLWYGNTYRNWVGSGGNGSAMRIQPHVWASRDLKEDFIPDVVTNTITTHAHPRAIIGACFHAAVLAYSLRTGSIPAPDGCLELVARLSDTAAVFDSSHELSSWRGLWEQHTGRALRDEWTVTIDEVRAALRAVIEAQADDADIEDYYREIVESLDLHHPDRRGSAVLTTVAAVALAAASKDPAEAITVAAGAIGTDTDTIGTMAGALLGTRDDAGDPPQRPVDADYLTTEADRLVALACGKDVESHAYPDVLTWVAPQTQADALVQTEGHLAVEGLGTVAETDIPPIWTPRKDFAWQWVRTDFGQTLLIKRRKTLKTIGAGNSLTPPPNPVSPPRPTQGAEEKPPGRQYRQDQNETQAPRTQLDRGVRLDAAVDYAKRHIDRDCALGYTVRRVARDGSLADLVALVAALRDVLRS